jgi:hypothetical protein
MERNRLAKRAVSMLCGDADAKPESVLNCGRWLDAIDGAVFVITGMMLAVRERPWEDRRVPGVGGSPGCLMYSAGGSVRDGSGMSGACRSRRCSMLVFAAGSTKGSSTGSRKGS